MTQRERERVPEEPDKGKSEEKSFDPIDYTKFAENVDERAIEHQEKEGQ